MKQVVIRAVSIVLVSFAMSNAGFISTAHGADTADRYRFRVFLDDRPIGYHEVSIHRKEDHKTVHTTASFDVRFLFIPVYSYQHETREQWESGCVVEITSTTDDNGDDYFINTQAGEPELRLLTQDGVNALEGCVRTFAYWDVNLLQTQRLLNTQTGEYQAVSVSDMGTGELETTSGIIRARHFKLEVEETTINLWYTDDMRWLALESETESGAMIRYLPDTPESLEQAKNS